MASCPIKKYHKLSPNYKGKRWAYVHLIRGATNHPIIYTLAGFGLHHEVCKCAHLRILKSEAPTNKFYFHRKNSHFVRHISILSPCKSDVRHIALISPCKSDKCKCAKSLVIFTRSIWGTCRNNCFP